MFRLPAYLIPARQRAGDGHLEEYLLLLNQQQQVDEAGRLVSSFLTSGGEPGPLFRTLAESLVREDAEFHSFQMLEAAIRQYGERTDVGEQRILMVAAARFLAAKAPTQRELLQTLQNRPAAAPRGGYLRGGLISDWIPRPDHFVPFKQIPRHRPLGLARRLGPQYLAEGGDYIGGVDVPQLLHRPLVALLHARPGQQPRAKAGRVLTLGRQESPVVCPEHIGCSNAASADNAAPLPVLPAHVPVVPGKDHIAALVAPLAEDVRVPPRQGYSHRTAPHFLVNPRAQGQQQLGLNAVEFRPRLGVDENVEPLVVPSYRPGCAPSRYPLRAPDRAPVSLSRRP